jgi:hypothetical protein
MPDLSYIKRLCPICRVNTSTKITVQSKENAEQIPLEGLMPHWNGFFKEKIIFSYVRCSKCKVLFTPVFFSSLQLQTLYAQMPPNMNEVPQHALKKTQLGYVKTLESHSGDSRYDYVEIGPDTGLFVSQLMARAEHRKYWLFEPNQGVVEQLSRVMSGKDFHIINDMFGFDTIPNGSASTIVMVHVLDHLLDPLDVLKTLRDKMNPLGRLLIVSHDESSFLRKLLGVRWPAFCLQHPQLFSRKTTEQLLLKAGFSIVTQKKTINYFKISFLLKHFLWALGLKINYVPQLGDATLGLKLGNIITIAKVAGNDDR